MRSAPPPTCLLGRRWWRTAAAGMRAAPGATPVGQPLLSLGVLWFFLSQVLQRLGFIQGLLSQRRPGALPSASLPGLAMALPM
jgi:hypothetical protein